MSRFENINRALESSELVEKLRWIYAGDEQVDYHRNRIAALIERFEKEFPEIETAGIYSAPGRTEIGGNHTDHQHGCVLAAAVNMDAAAAAAPNGSDIVVINSEGYLPFEVDLKVLEANEAEKDSPAAMVRGVAAYIANLGYKPGGFSASITSNVPGGSGLSSSACFEVLIGTIFNELFCSGELDSMTLARAGQYAENNYAMKPSGLLDQATASVGGLVSMDFARQDDPVLDSIKFNFEDNGYVLCVVNTGGSHANLTADYASITADMRSVAECFGKTLLNDVDEAEFYSSIMELRGRVGERAIVRAMHYFNETKRAVKQADALRADDIEGFIALVNESGRSSELYLQNIFPIGAPTEQGVTLGLAAANNFLAGQGAYRVHGGGFAGTIQAYVPKERYDDFCIYMEQFFGADCCHRLAVRPVGGIKII